MARKAICKDAIKAKTIADMQTLRVYKPEYDRLIEIYAELCEQYERLTKEFVSSGYQCTAGTGAGGEKKSPVVAALENLRKDILQYSDRLCLNPKAISSIDIPVEKKSKLGEALKSLS